MDEETKNLETSSKQTAWTDWQFHVMGRKMILCDLRKNNLTVQVAKIPLAWLGTRSYKKFLSPNKCFQIEEDILYKNLPLLSIIIFTLNNHRMPIIKYSRDYYSEIIGN